MNTSDISLKQILHQIGCEGKTLVLPNIYLEIGQQIKVFAAPFVPRVLINLDELDKVLEDLPDTEGFELVIKRVR